MTLVDRLRAAAPGTMLSMQVNDLEALREAADEIERLLAAQWPDEVTPEMKSAVYTLDLGGKRLSEDDVIDIYDALLKIVNQQNGGRDA